MNKLIKLTPLLLLTFISVFLTSCKKDEAPLGETEITGRVTDIETGEPLADVTVNLRYWVIDSYDRPTSTIIDSSVTDADGKYTVLIPRINDEEAYAFDLIKNSYIRPFNSSSSLYPLKHHKMNYHDMVMGKSSYLKLTVKKTPELDSDKYSFDLHFG